MCDGIVRLVDRADCSFSYLMRQMVKCFGGEVLLGRTEVYYQKYAIQCDSDQVTLGAVGVRTYPTGT